MAVTISDPFDPVSPDEIKLFELRTGIKLPEPYVRFLLRTNGGMPLSDVFDVPGWGGQASVLSYFYGIHEGRSCSLELGLERAAEVLPDGFLPIADDAGGNLLCMGLKGRRAGRLYFWDHEDQLDDEGNSKKDMSNMYEVARDLDEFLDKKLRKESSD